MKRFFSDERGATAIEYAILAAMLSLAVVAALGTLQGPLGDSYDNTANHVSDAIH